MSDSHREDCYFYTEDHDMGATIPCCNYYHDYGYCPCSFMCNKYVSKSDVHEAVKRYVDERGENTNAIVHD